MNSQLQESGVENGCVRKRRISQCHIVESDIPQSGVDEAEGIDVQIHLVNGSLVDEVDERGIEYGRVDKGAVNKGNVESSNIDHQGSIH